MTVKKLLLLLFIFEITLFVPFFSRAANTTFEKEVEQLFGTDNLTYSPDKNGIDSRVKEFSAGESMLALLYIDAIKEKFEVTNLDIRADLTEVFTPKMGAHTDHMFNNKEEIY